MTLPYSPWNLKFPMIYRERERERGEEEIGMTWFRFTLCHVRAVSLLSSWHCKSKLGRITTCLYYGRCLTNCIIDPSDEQFSEPTPPLQLYKKKLYVIHDAPALTNILNPHFTGFWGLYSRLLLHLVLAGMICLSTFITSSGYTFKQIASTTSSNGRILKSL